MNAAFAVGRLCVSAQAKNLILREAKEQQLVRKRSWIFFIGWFRWIMLKSQIKKSSQIKSLV